MSRTVQTRACARTVQNIIAPPTDSARDDVLSSLMSTCRGAPVADQFRSFSSRRTSTNRDSASQVRFPPHTPSTPTPSARQPRHGGDEPNPPDHRDGGDDDPDENPDDDGDNDDDDEDINIFGNPLDPDDLPANPIMALASAVRGLAHLSRRDPDADNSSSRMKVREPNTFDGTEPCKGLLGPMRAKLSKPSPRFSDGPGKGHLCPVLPQRNGSRVVRARSPPTG
ncbi:hypothetical protein PAXINDRAFT_13251 [Paxillus involutus ATCC 200175]|uniref:Unplaced genomic scaffold PAXINscaffold_25, whole genome shotgun sequence n=1 Tax=Paxillus involutus ATCC 200175 TaxID=664439 RepID=A0A0C9U3S5_PAXIN|nr:hypothetical protein PAXINDRAFT_13251 [Paxillus involutus ATCC 200175]